MTVNELIEHLKNYPPDMRVLTLGYEGGYDDVGEMRSEDVAFNVNNEDTWYYGSHELTRFMDELPNKDSQWRKTGADSGKCLIIGRRK
jgi:hypothetical protein